MLAEVGFKYKQSSTKKSIISIHLWGEVLTEVEFSYYHDLRQVLLNWKGINIVVSQFEWLIIIQLQYLKASVFNGNLVLNHCDEIKCIQNPPKDPLLCSGSTDLLYSIAE